MKNKEFKEVKVGEKTFAILKIRSFKRQCQIESAADGALKNISRLEVIKADCKILDLDRDDKGNLKGKIWRELSDEDFEELSDEEGDQLWLELINYRFAEQIKNNEELKKKIISTDLKKDGLESKTSLPSVMDGISII